VSDPIEALRAELEAAQAKAMAAANKYLSAARGRNKKARSDAYNAHREANWNCDQINRRLTAALKERA